MGDDQLQITLSYDSQGLREKEFSVGGTKLAGISATPWTVETDRGLVKPDAGGVRLLEASRDARRKASFAGQNDAFQWLLTYEAAGNGRITKQLSIVARRDVVLQRITMFDAKSATKPLVCRTTLSDIAAFFRQGKVGMFASLDFPYSTIAIDGTKVRIAYPPF